MSNRYDEKTGIAEREHTGKDLERTRTVYDDNYHGLHISTVLVYLALCLNYFVQLFNVVVSGAFTRAVAAAIGGSDKTVWLGQVIVIVTAVLGPPASQAADYWGRKWFLVGSAAFGFAGALITARASTFDQAIGGQVISSVFYIGQPILIAVASEIMPRKSRPAAQGGLNAAGAAGGLVALLAGTSLTTNNLNGWRSLWYISTALMGASGIIIALLYKPQPRPLQKSLTLGEKLGRLDWVGYVLLAIALTLFCMGLSWAESPYAWRNAHVVAPLVVGGIFIIALVLHQMFINKHGLLDHDLFQKDRNLGLALFCFFTDGMIFWAFNSYYPFQQSINYVDANTTAHAARLCMHFFSSIFFVAVIPIISRFTKSLREPIVISFAAYLIFFSLMATAKLSNEAAMWGYPVLMGLGLAWSLTYLTTAAQLSAPAHLIAITSGILLAIRSLGGSVALGIYNAIFNSTLNAKLGANIAAAVLPLGLPPQELGAFIGLLSAQSADVAKLPGVTPQMLGAGGHALQESFQESFKWVYVAAAVISGVSLIAACFFVNPKSDLNNHVDAPLSEDD